MYTFKTCEASEGVAARQPGADDIWLVQWDGM